MIDKSSQLFIDTKQKEALNSRRFRWRKCVLLTFEIHMANICRISAHFDLLDLCVYRNLFI